MNVGSQEWIEQSLAKLETLEQERASHESALETASDAASIKSHSQAIERLDDEIKSLYAQLESVANDEGDESEATQTNEFARAPVASTPAPAPAAPAPAPVATAPAASDDDDFASPFASAPVAASAPADFGGGGAFAASSYSDDDEPRRGGMMPLVIVGGLLVVGGAVAFIFMMPKPAPEPAPEAAVEAPVKVIKATEVPPDTSGPKAAQSGEYRPPSDDEKTVKAGRSGGGGGGGGGGGSKSSGSSAPASTKRGKGIEVTDADDPLGGI